MNKKEMKTRVRELLDSGIAKTEVFSQLSGQGVKDRHLAYFIASYADPYCCDRHEGKVNILITIMFVQAVMAFFLGFGLGARMGPNAKWIVGILIAFIPLSFALGFYKHRVGAYNAYIFLTIVQLPKLFDGFAATPIATSIACVINLVLLAYIWYVRDRLFPDFLFLTPKKIKGEYIFSG